MRIHKEGYSTLIFMLFISVAFGISACLLLSLFWVKTIILICLLSFFLFMLRFFRSPDRPQTIDPQVIIAPADGLVVSVQEEFEAEYFKNKIIKIAIFMSGHDVHINWAPVSGEISSHVYSPGKHLFARNPKSSELNERTRIVIEQNEQRTLLMSQIAGVMARRIVSKIKIGQGIDQGDEIGFIKLGSRVELYIPIGSDVIVKPGEKVSGRVSVLALWPE